MALDTYAHTRWALLKAPDRQALGQLGTLGEGYQRNVGQSEDH